MNETHYTIISNLSTTIENVLSDSIISRTVYKDEQFKAVMFGFAPGQSLSEHTAAQTAMLHFVEGEANVTVAEEALHAVPGTWIHLAPHVRHSVYARTAVKMLLLLIQGHDS